jgi:lipoprotein-releasing system ATP-binding protein
VPVDFRPVKPKLDLPESAPRPSVRLAGVLTGPDGRPLFRPPSIKLGELLGESSSLQKEKLPKGKLSKEKTMSLTFRKNVTGSSGMDVSVREPLREPFRLPFPNDHLPSLDLSEKTFGKKPFNDNQFNRFRTTVDGRGNSWRSTQPPEMPPLPNWDQNFYPSEINDDTAANSLSELKEIPQHAPFEDIDEFLARKKGMKQSTTEPADPAENKTENKPEKNPEKELIIEQKRIIIPVVRRGGETIFRRRYSRSVPNTYPKTDSKPEIAAKKQIFRESSAGKQLRAGLFQDELLHTENLTKSYYKKRLKIPVLKGVNLSIRKGEFISIIGQSGSGKSTLLHLLGTLDVPESGTIHFENRRIDNLSTYQRDLLRNRSIGFIFQFYHLLPELTTLENVLSPLMIRSGIFGYFFQRRRYIELAKEILDKVGLSHRLKHKPSELSGGEMQRAAIARALISEPKILLADEPTGNLDAASAAEIIGLLQRLKEEQHLTILMVTHDNQIAAVADRIVRMVDGVIENGTIR